MVIVDTPLLVRILGSGLMVIGLVLMFFSTTKQVRPGDIRRVRGAAVGVFAVGLLGMVGGTLT